MRILVTNDDGIYAPGLWTLVSELTTFADVMVVAPDREQSAIGAGITLHHPLRVQKVKSEIPGIESYAIGGTPGDCAIMAINHLAKGNLDLLVAGVNNGPNIGVDVFQSGTVGGALQGYMHGLSAIAISIDEIDSQHIGVAAKFTGILVKNMERNIQDQTYLLNVNIPGRSVTEIKGIRMTHLATNGLADTVEEGHDGRRQYYWLKYQKVNNNNVRSSDAWAVSRQYISITSLHKYLFRKPLPVLNGELKNLLHDFRNQVANA